MLAVSIRTPVTCSQSCRNNVPHAHQQIARSSRRLLTLLPGILAAPVATAAEELAENVTGLSPQLESLSQEVASKTSSQLSEAASSVSDALPPSSTASDVLSLFTDNPIAIVGVLFLAAVPLGISVLQGAGVGKVQGLSASAAYQRLEEEEGIIFIDIRSRGAVKEEGSPMLPARKKALSLPFTQLVEGELQVDNSFAERFSKLPKLSDTVVVILFDSYGNEASQAGKLVAELVGSVAYVRGGSTGAGGWKDSDLPWREPGRGFDLAGAIDNLAEDFKAQPTVAKAGIAAGALAVGSAVLLQEVGTAVEALGALALGSFAINSFLSSSPPSTRREAKDAAGKAVGQAQKQAGKVQRQVQAATKEVKREAKTVAPEATKKVERQIKRTPQQLQDMAGEVQRQASTAASQVEANAKDTGLPQQAKAAANGTGARAKEAANSAAGDVKAEASKTDEGVKEGAQEVAQEAKANASEAREWIESWREGAK